MIKLYESTERQFQNNGFGFLNDAITCTVSEKLNGEYELEMTYPVDGIHYSDIIVDRLILVDEKNKKPQAFRIYSISKPINQIITVKAQHISYDLSNIIVKGEVEQYAYTTREVFRYIRACVIDDMQPFNFITNVTKESKMDLSKPRSIRSILGTDDNGILTVFGGEYEFDMFDVIHHQRRGSDTDIILEYGKNITDFTQEENISEMYTHIYPYYYQEDDGLQVLDSPLAIVDTSLIRQKVLVLDLSSNFEEMPTQDQLKEETKKYITDNKLNEPKVSITVSFIYDPDAPEYLQDIRLGDTVTIIFKKLGITSKSRCISTTYNVIEKKYDSIEFGEPSDSLIDTIVAAEGNISSIQSDLNKSKVTNNRTTSSIYQNLQNAQGDITNLQLRANGFDIRDNYMLKTTKQITLSGISSIAINGQETQIAVMSATIPMTGMPQITKGIQNQELFQANKDTVIADFAAFDEKVYEIMDSLMQEESK